jgi:2-amino-4-hydroxy-6-hydroxymethyldihydropteridine diphosphokinase
VRVIIALGSNLGDRWGNLAAGLEEMRRLGWVTPSPLVMETPDESGNGPDYLNSVAFLETELDNPCPLLEELLRIELRLGRDRGQGRNAPRTLDLDLIEAEGLSGQWRWPAPQDLESLGAELTLELPHPRALQRAFVQEPITALRRVLE